MSTMFRKKETFTVITPIPGFIPRQLAIDILHSHSEVITLNPLVLEHKPISAPRDALADEFYSTWYEITERIQYIPGMGKMGSGTITFNGCFHDMPWGLQTHIYAPLNVDLRNKYRIAGNQPGVEPPKQPEIGLKALGAPLDGLYLREDIEIRCNIAVMSFVKAELKKAGKEMVARIIKKAELLDAGVLKGMIENGKLKTLNPSDRAGTIRSPIPSPVQLFHQSGTPKLPSPSPSSPSQPYQVPRPQSYVQDVKHDYNRPPSALSHTYSRHGQHPALVQEEYGPYNSQQLAPMELPGSEAVYITPATAIEMPGDFEYYHQPQPSPGLSPNPNAPPTPSSFAQSRDSTRSAASEPAQYNSPDPASQAGRWSANDFQPTSQLQASWPTSLASSNGGFRSPGLEHKGFASDLARHNETTEEHRTDALRQLQDANTSATARIPQPSHFQQYNPADYAKEQHALRMQNQQQQATYAYGNQVLPTPQR